METSELDRLSAPVTVSVRDVHVRYRVNDQKRRTTAECFRSLGSRRSSIEVHALKGIDFELFKGDSLGVLGDNGSGKSTLLRCIAGVQPLANGQVLVRGRPQLLSVGAALKPSLSGHRNVMLGGLAVGLSRSEILERMPDLLDFSGLGEAIDRPMSTYSSGMRARLAFAIATLRTPEILLIDEALAVGDADFRRRSLDRINQLKSEANTVVMVTHNLGEIRKTCSRAIWLDGGLVRADGPAGEIIDAYKASRPRTTQRSGVAGSGPER